MLQVNYIAQGTTKKNIFQFYNKVFKANGHERFWNLEYNDVSRGIVVYVQPCLSATIGE